jgi:hypothetical protein
MVRNGLKERILQLGTVKPSLLEGFLLPTWRSIVTTWPPQLYIYHRPATNLVYELYGYCIYITGCFLIWPYCLYFRSDTLHLVVLLLSCLLLLALLLLVRKQ